MKDKDKEGWRKCSICGEGIDRKEQGEIVAMKALKYYKNYNKEVGSPEVRLNVIFCAEHTKSFLRWQKNEQADTTQ